MGLSAGKLEDSYVKTNVKLGAGSFGTVWRGLNKSNQQAVAIKEICKHRPGDSKSPSAITAELCHKEISIMRSISHTNILQLLASFEEDLFFEIVLEYCDGGDLADKIQQLGNTITTAMAANWTQQVVSAVHALHAKHIVHRDIKPGNFLIAHSDCNAGPNSEVLKLADFGIATVLPREDQKLFERTGTRAFMAPEQIEIDGHEGYGKPADMWSVGVMMYMFLHAGRNPFMSGGRVNQDKRSQGLRPKPQSCSISTLWRNSDKQSGKELYRRLLLQLPDLRPTAQDALEDVFLIA